MAGRGGTAVFLRKIRVTSNRESGTILIQLGPDILKCIAAGNLCFSFANRDPKILRTNMLTRKMILGHEI